MEEVSTGFVVLTRTYTFKLHFKFGTNRVDVGRQERWQSQ